MRSIIDLINEKLNISSKSNVHKFKELEPEEIEGPETPGKDYFDDDVVIIGWPFKDKHDKNYKRTKDYIRSHGFSICNDLEMIEDAEFFDYFCYVLHTDPEEFFTSANANDNNELNCYIYGPEGVEGYSEK